MGSGSNEDSIGQNRSAVRRASLSSTAFCPGFRPSRHLLPSVISRRGSSLPRILLGVVLLCGGPLGKQIQPGNRP